MELIFQQSNYPPSGGNPYAAGAGGYGGPPPPPGGGYGTGSAYNVNQYPSYGGYGMGNPPPGKDRSGKNDKASLYVILLPYVF